MTKRYVKLLIFLGAALLIGSFFAFDLQQFLSLDALRARHTVYQQSYEQNQLLALSVYFLAIFLLTALSIPGLAMLMLAGGALFDFPAALLIVSFADVLGSAAAFLTSRHLFRNGLQSRHCDRLRIVNQGVEREGALYLLSMRLMPLFPCFLINLLMGLTKLRLTTFCWVTQLGKLPHNAIYVNAGTQVGQMESLRGIISPGMIVSFILIGTFPLIAKKGLIWYRKNRTNRLLNGKIGPLASE